MPVTSNNFNSFGTGGLEGLSAVTGTATVASDIPAVGTYYCKMIAGTADITLNAFDYVSDAGDKQGVSFYFNKGGNLDRILVRGREGTTDNTFTITLIEETGSTFSLQFKDANDANSTGSTKTDYDIETWYKCDIIWEHLASGTLEVFVDGVSQISKTGMDLEKTGTFDRYTFGSASIHIDHILIMSGLTDETDIPADWEEFVKQTTKTGIVADAGVLGNATTGYLSGDWGNVADTPLNASTEVEYDGNSGGSVDTAVLGAEIDGDDNIKLIIGHFHLDRDGGGGTTHYVALGNDGDGNSPPATVVTVTTTPTTYSVGRGTDLPLKSVPDKIRMGMWADGAQDIHNFDMWAMILHVPGGGAGVSIAPTPGTIATAGQPVTITLQTNIDPTPSTIATAGQAVTVDPITAIDPATGVIGTAGQPVTMTLETVETPAPGVIATAGQPVNISAELIMPVIPGEIALSGLPVDLSLETQIGPALGVIAIAGLPVSMLVATSLTPATAIIGTVGQPVSVVPDLVVVPAPAVIAMAGLPVDIVLETILAPGLAAIALAGLPVDMILETAIQPAPAVIGLVGQPVSLAIETIITPGAAVIATSGFGVTMVLETAMSIVTGVIATVGQAVVVALGGVISPAFGIIAMAGRPVSLVPEVIANVRHWRRRIIRRRLARRSRR